MQRFLLRRFIVMIISLFAVSLIIFIMARATGDPRTLLLDDYATQEQWDAMGRLLGLDKPLYHQYAIFISGVVQGDFGDSIRERRPVMGLIWERLPNTIYVGLTAFVFSLVIGIPLGIIGAVKRGSLIDKFGKGLALVGQSAPSFWIGIMLMFFFAVKLGWVPPSGKSWAGLILPTITLGWLSIAANMRLIRSSMLDVLDSEYVKLARAKGVPARTVIWKHAFRNALIAPLTFAAVTFSGLVSGSLITETIFAWPGIGRLAVQALFFLDYPVLQGTVIVITLMYLMSSLFVDVLLCLY